METYPHCTVPGSRNRLDSLWLLLLTAVTLLVHGYHPWAEDGGLYAAGVERTLDPSLFPHGTAFVTGHLPYSGFTPAMAALVRLSGGSLAAVLLSVYLFSTALMLYAALRVARQCFRSPAAHWTAVALLAAWWTLPIAGTSLLLMDPYVTARSLSTPLSLLATAAALESWPPESGWPQRWRPQHLLTQNQQTQDPPPSRGSRPWHPALACVVWLLAAALFHPLMAMYTAVFLFALALERAHRPRREALSASLVCLLLAAFVQLKATPEPSSVLAAAHTRYYWFLAEWHWFEWLGLAGPLAVFTALLRSGPALPARARALCRAAVSSGLLAIIVALLLARESLPAHPVARLQPLRMFLMPYAVMILLLGGTLADWTAARAAGLFRPSPTAHRLFQKSLQSSPAIAIGLLALAMFFVQRATYPSSLHLELPGRRNPNTWASAFLWARDHTPTDALFALDAHYINTGGEDAQTFRSLAQRDALPDFAKDGGQAANLPRLAPEWARAVAATDHLSAWSDATRDAALHPFGVRWVILHADATTRHPCPYRNAVVKVCQLP